MEKPLLAITMGDPAGVGPETIVGAWADASLHEAGRMMVLGHPEILRRAQQLLAAPAEVVEIAAPEEAVSSPSVIPCLPCGSPEATLVEPGTVDPRGGQAAYDAIVLAAELALAGRVDGMVTAPLNKVALSEAGYPYPGHTEILADLCGVDEVGMMLYLAPGENVLGRVGLGVAHVTLHTPLRDIFQQLSVAAICSKARLADSVFRALLSGSEDPATPRVAICALNPHAGEGGLFGDEERLTIEPAVRQLRSQGLNVEGPLPADTLLMRAARGHFDAVVAMYHDQGHIALKLLGMHRAVNITLGLPIVRTSVAHGTAFDLAWQGQAETSGMVEATRIAYRLVERRDVWLRSGDMVAR